MRLLRSVKFRDPVQSPVPHSGLQQTYFIQDPNTQAAVGPRERLMKHIIEYQGMVYLVAPNADVNAIPVFNVCECIPIDLPKFDVQPTQKSVQVK